MKGQYQQIICLKLAYCVKYCTLLLIKYILKLNKEISLLVASVINQPSTIKYHRDLNYDIKNI